MADTYIGELEVGDSVFHIVRTIEDIKVHIGGASFTKTVPTDVLQAGTCCNVGFIPHYTHVIDPVFSLDENLQAFVERIQEEEESNGE